MTQILNRFRRMARQTTLVKDERGLSTVEYVIILVLIAAAAVGTWTKFGGTIVQKINDSNAAIGSASVNSGNAPSGG